MKSTVKLSLLTIVSIALAALPLQAADNPEHSDAAPKKEGTAPANPNRAIPFHGKLDAKTDSSITVGKRTFEVTPETKFVKAGKPATMVDGVVGEEVAGAYLDKEGKLTAKSVRFGPKPEAATSGEKTSKKAEAGE